MTGIVKTDQIQGAQSSTITIPGSNNLVIGGNLTVDTNTLYVDSTNNRVGVGTVSPSQSLHVKGNIDVEGDTSGVSKIRFKAEETHGEVEGINIGNNFGGLAFKTNSNGSVAERMRIDSNGNLLVGATAESNWETVAGFRTRPSGSTTITRSAAPVLYANRLSSDGDIAEFRKDGTLVGSIGTNSGILYIGSTEGTDAFLGFGNDIIRPVTSAGASRDNAIDLGYSGMRFRNLYLSGGVTTGTESNFVSATSTNIVAKSTNGNGGYLNYSGLSSGGTTTFSVTHNGKIYAADGIQLGGTGSANHLDDYEEGTWTPSISFSSGGTVSYTRQEGSYTKIGRNVYIDFALIFTISGASGSLLLNGLPFAHATTSTNDRGVLNLGYIDRINASDMTFLMQSTTNIAEAYYYNGTYKNSAVTTSQINTGDKNLHGSGTYKTT